MTVLVIDTHVLAWSLAEPERVSSTAAAALFAADAVCISTVSLYEIAQKVRLGKWPQMLPFRDRLEDVLEDRGMFSLPLSISISIHAGLLDWPHRDPFDRMIAATALVLDLPLISADMAFDSLPDLRRVW